MEKSVSVLLTQEVLALAAQKFGARVDSCQLLSDVENFVFTVEGEAGLFILRITHSSHRTEDEILAELEWVAYLRSAGLPVTSHSPSTAGALVEKIELAASSFFVTAFERIMGENIIDANACTPENYQAWGRLMGKMHRLAKSYKATHFRKAWFENEILVNAEKYLAGQPLVIQKLRETIARLSSLRQEVDTYGLIHSDLTDVNFFVNEHGITLFDFDDCEYHWFAYDLAVVLFDCLPWLPHEGMTRDAFGAHFLRHFLEGYNLENELAPESYEQIPLFMKMRELFLYIVFHKKWDLENLSDARIETLHRYRQRILGNISSLEMEFKI